MVFIPIFPICFQFGTDQNPCRCKVIGPTLGELAQHKIEAQMQSIPALDIMLNSFSGFLAFIVAGVCTVSNSDEMVM